jgi:outer membrane protein assembly factor BamB
MKTAIALMTASLALILHVLPAAADEPTYRVKYLNSMDARATGKTHDSVASLYLAPEEGELYVLEPGRVVISDLAGTPLHHFALMSLKGVANTAIAVDQQGRILVGGGQNVAIMDYRGDFLGYLSLDNVPEKESLQIQSIAVGGDGSIYIGSSGANARIIKLDASGKFVSEIKAEKRFVNVVGLTLEDDGFTFLDPGYYTVWRMDWSGNERLRFGKLSSLLGGFSQPAGIALDAARGRILVIDTNRLMVIIFDMKTGASLYEFGGPSVFRWPRRIAVDSDGKVYVADGTGLIRVFEVIVEAPAGAQAPSAPVDAPAGPAPSDTPPPSATPANAPDAAPQPTPGQAQPAAPDSAFPATP